MALPTAGLVRTVYGGTLVGGEIWRSSMWWWVVDTMTSTVVGNYVDSWYSNFSSLFWNPGSNKWASIAGNSNMNLDFCTGFGYEGGVLVAESAGGTHTAVAGAAATVGANFQAAVVTLQTAAFGRSARGRNYLPALGAVSGTTGNLAVVQAHATNFAAALAAVRTALGGQPVVVSKTDSLQRTITHVRIDSLADTQRGRQSAMTPAGTFTAAV